MSRSHRSRSVASAVVSAMVGLALVAQAPRVAAATEAPAPTAETPTTASAAETPTPAAETPAPSLSGQPTTAATTTARSAYTMRLVGPADAAASWSEDVNDRGVVVGGSSTGGWTTARSSAPRLLPAKGPAATYGFEGRPTFAARVNDRGSVLGLGPTQLEGGQYQQHLLNWRGATKGPVAVAGPFLGLLQSVNPVALNAGGTSLYVTGSKGLGATAWVQPTDGAAVRLPESNNEGFSAVDLDDHGTAIARSRPYYHGGPFVPGASVAVEFRRGWTTATILPSLPESPQADGASAISPDGRWIVGRSGTTSVRWDARRRVSKLDNAPAGFWAVDINRHGTVVGSVGNDPWVWSKGEATPLNSAVSGVPAGLSLCRPKSINRYGEIALSLCKPGVYVPEPVRAIVLTPASTR